jgi:predicted site-specific integrase-resolvase
MLNYKPRTLREYSKKGILSINFMTLRGKKFHYSKSDIERLMLENSTIN